MKIFTTLLLVFIPAGTQSGARGQAVISPAVIPVPLTKLEAFAATTGTLLATETYSLLGIYGEHSCNIRVQVIDHHVRDRAGSWESAGLRVEIADSTRKNMVAAYIDLDELENLSKSHQFDARYESTRHVVYESSLEGAVFFFHGRTQDSHGPEGYWKKLIVSHLFAGGSCVVNRDTSVIELKTAIDKVLQDLR